MIREPKFAEVYRYDCGHSGPVVRADMKKNQVTFLWKSEQKDKTIKLKKKKKHKRIFKCCV